MNDEIMVIAPAPTTGEETGVIGSADTVTYIETKPSDTESVIGGADGPTAILTTGASVSENMTSAVEILGQGMASIFVVLGIIAVFVSLLKKLDNKKK